MTHLNGYKDNDVEFKVNVYDPRKNESFDWRDVFNEHDIVYFNYTTNDIGYAIMGLMAQKYGKLLICDMDDDIFNILIDNPVYKVFEKDSKNRQTVQSILNDVHYVTCTNLHLKHAIAHYTYKSYDKLKVFPNFIDLNLYKYRCKFKDKLNIVLGHFGSSTHFISLANENFYKAVDRIMMEFPNVSFHAVGSFFGKYKMKWGQRYETKFGDIDIYKWIDKMPKFMDEIDIVVVPLEDNVYNRSKSSCKYLETSSYKKPGIWQNIRQYNEIVKDGVNGFIARTEDEWYEKIKRLCTDNKLRLSMGEEAYKTVKSDWTIQSHIPEYSEWFKQLLDI
jgi:glycosyltransferase involved in cell wall biosynthesis